MSATSVIRVIITGDEHGAKHALQHVRKDAKSTGMSLKNMAKVGAAGFAVLAAGAVALGVESVKAAEKEEKSHNKLLVALKNTGQSWTKNKEAIEKADKAGEHFGYTSAETEEALAMVETSTGNTGKSLKLLALAQNLAALKGVDLNSAMMAVTKASQGQLKPLKQLGVDLPIAAGGALKLKKAQDALTKTQQDFRDATAHLRTAEEAQAQVEDDIKHGRITGKDALKAMQKAIKDVNFEDDKRAKIGAKMNAAEKKVNDTRSAGTNITKALAKMLKGQAAAAAETFQGRVKELKAKMEDWQASIGKKIIPILMQLMDWIQKKLVPALQSMFGWLSEHKIVMEALAVVVGTVIAGLIAYKVAVTAINIWNKLWAVGTKLVAAAQWVLNAAMNANPIMLVVVAIAALAAGLYLAYKKVKWFHTAVDFMWQLLQTGFHWVQKNWPKLLAILTGPIGIAVYIIASHWSSIVNGFHTVVSGIRNGVGKVVGFITGIPGRIAHVGAAIGHMLGGAFKGAINFLIGGVNQLIDLVNKFQVHIKAHKVLGVTVLPGFDWNGLQLPHIPTFHGGGVYTGEDDGMASLAHGEGIFTPAQMRALGLMAASNRGGNGGNTIFNMPAGVDPAKVVRAKATHDRRNGKTR